MKKNKFFLIVIALFLSTAISDADLFAETGENINITNFNIKKCKIIINWKKKSKLPFTDKLILKLSGDYKDNFNFSKNQINFNLSVDNFDYQVQLNKLRENGNIFFIKTGSTETGNFTKIFLKFLNKNEFKLLTKFTAVDLTDKLSLDWNNLPVENVILPININFTNLFIQTHKKFKIINKPNLKTKLIAEKEKIAKRNDDAIQLNIPLSGSLQNPAFSPDGKLIVFTRFRNGYNKGTSDLFIYNIETEEITPLVINGYSNVNLPGSVWNGISHSITFSSEKGTHDEIFSIQDTSQISNEVQLTSRPDKQSFEPSFSSNGEWIVFESHNIDVENDGVITKYKVDGSSGYIDLTFANENAKQPNWSPVNDKILYQQENNKKWTIWTMDTNGQNNKAITKNNESATDAVFSYDGKWIIYSSENEDVKLANIYKIPVEGGTTIRITSYCGYDGAVSISPDSSTIAFESTATDPEKSKGATLWLLKVE